MNHLKAIILVFFIGIGSYTDAQESLSTVPKKAEEYQPTEQNAIATINWLENTPIGTETDKRKEQSKLLIEWLMGSPTVTIQLDAYIMDYCEKNTELFTLFMGGWAKYALENSYSKDALQGNLAGIRSMIKVYKAGGLKKDKKVQELVDLDASGKLEDWLKKKLKMKE